MSKPTPRHIHNRQSGSSLSRRVGRTEDFYGSLIRSLSDLHRPGLTGLTTRDPQDFSIAMLGAWASVGDVLTFYQERHNDEAYLGTAKERLSLEQIAALIGYTPAPPTSAQVYLMFDVDDALPMTEPLIFEAGIAVKNIPVETQLPQTFETTEPFRGAAAWNEIKPIQRFPQKLNERSSALILSQTSPRPRRGHAVGFLRSDTLLKLGPSSRYTKTVTGVNDDAEIGAVRLDLNGTRDASIETSSVTKQMAPPSRELETASTEAFLEDLNRWAWPVSRIEKARRTLGLTAFDIRTALSDTNMKPDDTRAVMFDIRARLFGHNGLKQADTKVDWPKRNDVRTAGAYLTLGQLPPAGHEYIYLDRNYEGAVAGDFIVLRGMLGGHLQELSMTAVAADTVSVSGFGLAGEVTRLTVKIDSNFTRIDMRTVEILTGTQPLKLDQVALESSIGAPESRIVCAGTFPDLVTGQWVAITGPRADFGGSHSAEILKISAVELHGENTALMFETPPQYQYMRKGTSINANIALASHGETVEEVLGSGDAARDYQTFDLSRGPLTYLPSASSSGRAAALTLTVNGVRWTPTETFETATASTRAFKILPLSPEGTRLMFGNGRQGARLPSGTDNVVVSYRVGAGPGGRVGAGQLTLLSRKPLGIRGVTNPLAAFGGSLGEGLDSVRENASKHLSTLGRVVSLQDYEAFAQSFAGIAKAHASWGWRGENRTACVTVGGENGQILPDGVGILPTIRQRLKSISAPGAQITVKPHTPVTANLVCRLFTDIAYTEDDIIRQSMSALLEAFGFDRRSLGEPLRATKVMAVLQTIPGVIAVDIDLLYRADETPRLNTILRARRPANGRRDNFMGAELITFARDNIRLTVLPMAENPTVGAGGGDL